MHAVNAEKFQVYTYREYEVFAQYSREVESRNMRGNQILPGRGIVWSEEVNDWLASVTYIGYTSYQISSSLAAA